MLTSLIFTYFQTGTNEVLTEKAKSRLKSNVIRFKDEVETSQGDDNKVRIRIYLNFPVWFNSI